MTEHSVNVLNKRELNSVKLDAVYMKKGYICRQSQGKRGIILIKQCSFCFDSGLSLGIKIMPKI